MDDEVEDIVGDLQYTDSQKSVTTSAVYSLDFDSSPERQNSSGKETYVIERDDSDDSETTFRFHTDECLNNLNEAMSPKSDMEQLLYNEINKSIRANFKTHSLQNHEFTQTSKTIMELAQNEIIVVHQPTQRKSLETQTSFVSIAEHKTIDREFHVVDKDGIPKENETHQDNTIQEDICDYNKMLIPDIRSSHKNTSKALNKMLISDIRSSHKNNTDAINKMLIPDIRSSHKNTNEDINKKFIPDTESTHKNNKDINKMFIPDIRSSHKNTNEDMNKMFVSDTQSSHKNSNKDINKMVVPGIRSSHKNNEDINKMCIPDTPSSYKNSDEDSNNIFNPVAKRPLINTNEQVVTEENTLSSFQGSELDNTTGIYSEHSSEDKIIPFIDDESKENEDHKETYCETTSELESSKYDSDIEEDSLMVESEYRSSVRSKGDNASDTSEMQKSIDNDLDELYNKLSESPLLLSPENSMEPGARKFGTLTPLTEETSQRKSFLDMTTSSQTLMETTKDTDNETLFVNNAGVKIKMFSNCEIVKDNDKFKLPPILNKSCPTSPHLNFLFSVNTNPLEKVGNLPCLLEGHNDGMFENWEDGSNHLASGESPLITGKSDPAKPPREPVHLPPIHVEGGTYHNSSKPTSFVAPHQNTQSPEADAISIKGRIKELKMTNRSMSNNRARSKLGSRSVSPTSMSSREEHRMPDVAERGCDNLCIELLRKLRSASWVEVLETLEDIPRSLEKFWPVLTVNRTAELLRQVTVHIDSPRTQVARSACTILAEILKNTNYTRKPDFYEGIAMLLMKTGSFSRPVRRAANVALDDIACGVDVTHAATAICIYGVGHKSALVRCASARLLVVCCALAEGGRQILRARPPTAVAARKHVLRALAELLQDKNIDTRKYAERLYTILRPLPSFEAYFLSDVDAEVAARHMKKYDPLLIHKRDSATSLAIFS